MRELLRGFRHIRPKVGWLFRCVIAVVVAVIAAVAAGTAGAVLTLKTVLKGYESSTAQFRTGPKQWTAHHRVTQICYKDNTDPEKSAPMGEQEQTKKSENKKSLSNVLVFFVLT